MKRLLWTTLLSLCSLTLSAESFTVDGLSYDQFGYLEEGTSKIAVKVTGANSSLTELNVPAQVEFKGVTYNVLKIGWQAFRNHSLQTVIFAEGLEEIEDEAFWGSTIGDGIRLKVVFPKSLKKIGRRAFYQASQFLFDETSLTPNVTLGTECFHQSKWHKDKLAGTEEIIYAGKTIYGALPTVTALSQVREGTASIVDGAFKQHPNLQSVTLPGTINTIPYEAFRECPKLQSVEIGDGTEIIDQSAFNGCPALTTLKLPNSIKLIWWWAFYNCKKLGKITLPSQLGIIGNYAFENCTQLDIVGEWPKGLTLLGDSPNGCVFKNCTQLKSASIADNVKDINSETFSGCSSLTTVKLPARLREIGQLAFADCPMLETCRFPDSIAVIGAGAFLNCTKLNIDEKNIADTVLLGTDCFKNTVWYNQQPGNVLYLGTRLVGVKTDDRGNAFKLTDVEIKPGTTRILPAAFYLQDQLSQVKMPDDVEVIGEYAFFGCELLSQVNLPAHLKELKTCAFSGCNPLTKFELPKELEYIGANAMNNTSITSLTIPKSVTRKDSLALAGIALKELVIEDAKSMGGYPFYVDYALMNVASESPTSTDPSVAKLVIDQERQQVAIGVFKKGIATLNSPIRPDYTTRFGENYPLTIRADMPPIVVPDGWTTPAARTYPERTAIYARMGNDERRPLYGDMIAAFINGECRGTYTFTGKNSIGLNRKALPYEVITLEVWGSREEVDAHAAITFKYSRNGLVYDVVSSNTSDIVADFQTYGSPKAPVLFPLPVALTNLTLRLADPSQQVLEVMVDETIDLDRVLEKVLEPKDATLPPGSYWDAGYSRNFTITGSTLTGINPSPDGNESVYLHYKGINAASGKVEDMVATFSQLLITPKVTPVTGIEAITPTTSSTDAIVNVPFTVEFRVQPADATDMDVILSQTDNDLKFGPITKKEVSNEFSVAVTPLTVGKHSMTIQTVDGKHSLSLQVNAKTRYESVAFDVPTASYEVGTKCRLPHIIVTPAEPVFDPAHLTKVKVTTTEVTAPQYGGSFAPQLCEVGKDADGWYFIPKVVCQNAQLQVEISGMLTTVDQTVNFDKVYTKDKGWSWVSVPYTYDFLNGENDRSLVEVRSSDKMMYNDATYGWFGQTFKMEPGQAYKQNAVAQTRYKVAYLPSTTSHEVVDLLKGWNWIGVPYEYDFSMDMIEKNGVLTLVYGDMILSKKAVYLCDGSTWQSSVAGDVLSLQSGEGYLYLSTADHTKINWGAPFGGPIFTQHKTRAMADKFASANWHYDVSKYSSTMAVVAKMEQELEQDYNQYSIGAFVAGECRGEGRILDSGLMLISVNGEPGEKVNFVLHNMVAETDTDFENIIDFCRMAGSMSVPLVFNLKNDVSGVENVEEENLNVRFDGNEIRVDGNYVFTVYSTDGKRVANKDLRSGVYVVEVVTHNGPVTIKLVKK